MGKVIVLLFVFFLGGCQIFGNKEAYKASPCAGDPCSGGLPALENKADV
jgi:hypothetical protein